MTSDNTFDIADLASGNVDLFIVVPSDAKKILAPFLRWLLSDLFAVARRTRMTDRVLVFIDEAGNLGRFDEVLSAASELPGRGISLWTFWQNRHQLMYLYGEHDAASLVNLAEVVTFSDLPTADPDGRERWSRAIGVYTAFVESTSTDATGKTSTSSTRQAVRLMTPEHLKDMKSNELIALLNSRRYTRDAIQLHKTESPKDPRFERFFARLYAGQRKLIARRRYLALSSTFTGSSNSA